MNAAITGFGGVGEIYELVLDHLEGVDLVSVCDVDPAQLADLDDVATYTDHEEMLHSEDVDLSIVGTPPTVRSEVVDTAVGEASAVLIEKPTATNLDEFERLAALDAESDAVVSAVQNVRFVPTIQGALTSIADGLVGDVVSVEVLWSQEIDLDGADMGQESWASELPVGGITESMPHFLYLALAFVDDLSEFTVQWHRRRGDPDHPDGLAILGRDTRDRMVKVQWTSVCEHRRRRVRVYGSEGELTADLDRRTLTVTKGGKSDTVRPIEHSTIPDPVKNRWARGHYNLVEQLVRSSQSGDLVPPVPLSEDYDVVRVLDEAGSQWVEG